MFLILFSRNNHKLHCQLKLQPRLRLVSPRFPLHLLVMTRLPIVMLNSLPRLSWLNPRLHLLPFHRLRRPKGSVEQDQANFRVEPLLRYADVPVMFSPAKVVSLRRLSSVEESLSVSKRIVSQVKHVLHGSGNTRSLVVLKRTSFWSLWVLRNIFCFRNPSFRTPTFICLVKWRIRLYLCVLWLLKSLLWWLVYGNLCSLSNRFVNIDL